MSEWCASKTQIAPWFLDSTIMSIDEFAQFVRMLDDCEHGIVDKNFDSLFPDKEFNLSFNFDIKFD